MHTEQSVMEGGTGESSYARNSGLQAELLSTAWPAISTAVKNTGLVPDSGVIRIADLGCSSGWNTIHLMNSIVEIIKKFEGDEKTEFQAFFSDLPANDYNTLFSLIPFKQGDPYFYGAVPGSFYERLFPSSSIHLATSCMAVQWLSKVPDAVRDEKSSSWNPGTVWASKGTPALQAFQEQSHKDLCKFLEARSEEMVPGGLLCILILSSFDFQTHVWTASFQKAWDVLVKEGKIEQHVMDSYNCPVYFRDNAEIRKSVEAVGPSIELVHLENYGENSPRRVFHELDSSVYASRVTGTFKALCKRTVEEFVSDPDVVEELFTLMESFCPPKEDQPLLVPVTLTILRKV